MARGHGALCAPARAATARRNDTPAAHAATARRNDTLAAHVATARRNGTPAEAAHVSSARGDGAPPAPARAASSSPPPARDVGMPAPRAAVEAASPRLPVVLGIDPGTLVVGYGAVVAAARGPRLLASGALRAGRELSVPERLAWIRAELDRLIALVRPTTVVVEMAFAARNVQSALRIGEGRGVVLACAAATGCEVVQFAPAVAKKSLVGHGGADKSQVARMVAALLGLEAAPEPLDATDALALALAHVQRGRLALRARGRDSLPPAAGAGTLGGAWAKSRGKGRGSAAFEAALSKAISSAGSRSTSPASRSSTATSRSARVSGVRSSPRSTARGARS